MRLVAWCLLLASLASATPPNPTVSKPFRIISFSYLPFKLETYSPITPSNIWQNDMTRKMSKQFPLIVRQLREVDSVPPERFNLERVRMAAILSDHTEVFVDAEGIMLAHGGCYALPKTASLNLQKQLDPIWLQNSVFAKYVPLLHKKNMKSK